MSQERTLTLNLDAMLASDGLDVEENVLFDAYWAADADGQTSSIDGLNPERPSSAKSTEQRLFRAALKVRRHIRSQGNFRHTPRQ
jgi:hypothetical protein